MSNARAYEQPDEVAHTVVAIGMSAGAVLPLRALLTALPRAFRSAIVIAHHVGSHSVLPDLIRHWTGRDARFARPGDPVLDRAVHVCPAEHHIVVNPDATFGISSSERVAFVRPSIDWLFESVAASYASHAIAVLLSGSNSDGARGAEKVARGGGVVLVQDPATCSAPQMPLAALGLGVVRAALSPFALAAAIVEHAAAIDRVADASWLRATP